MRTVSRAGRRRTARRAAGAIVDQFVVAGTSFVLMILVRREIGRAALGEYAWLLAIMIVLTGLQTAWVGDTLTVGDRFDRRTRSGLTASLLAFGASSFVVAGLVAMFMVRAGSALLFGAMVMFWIFEETGRRLFMARMEFWALVVNDAAYAVGAFAALAVFVAVAGHFSVTIVVAAMLSGALTSIVVAWFQLPRSETTWERPDLRAMRELTAFAGWRSLQMGIRPMAQALVRTFVIVFVSKASAGDLESARLFCQPAMTYVSGVASLLLPMYTEEEQQRTRAVPVSMMTGLLVIPVLLYGIVVVIWKNPIAHRVFADSHGISSVAVIGWLATAAMFAAGQPVANLLIARRQSRAIFLVRAADSAIGLAAAAFLIDRVSPNYAPWALAGGMVVGTIGLAVVARGNSTPGPFPYRTPVFEVG